MSITFSWRAATRDPKIAAAALQRGLALARIEQRFGELTYVFDEADIPAGKTLTELYANIETPPYAWAATHLWDAVDRYSAEETRKQRQGDSASDSPSYALAELRRMTPEQMQRELPSVRAALAAKHVSGMKEPPQREARTAQFTGSQLKAMHPDDMQRHWEEIDAARNAGLIDWSS